MTHEGRSVASFAVWMPLYNVSKRVRETCKRLLNVYTQYGGQ